MNKSQNVHPAELWRVHALSLRAFSYFCRSDSDLNCELAASQTYL